jgi:hypothetical protein
MTNGCSWPKADTRTWTDALAYCDSRAGRARGVETSNFPLPANALGVDGGTSENWIVVLPGKNQATFLRESHPLNNGSI